MTCQSIRKSKFQEMQNKFEFFTEKLKATAFSRYKDLIRKPML